MTRELPKSMAPPPGEAMATLKAAASRGGLGMIKGPSYGGPQLENVSRPLFSGKRADLALVPESPLRVKRAGRDYNVPSVTKILKAAMPASQKLALQRWEEKMVASMGRAAFDEMNRRTLQRGKCLHGHVERTLMGSRPRRRRTRSCGSTSRVWAPSPATSPDPSPSKATSLIRPLITW